MSLRSTILAVAVWGALALFGEQAARAGFITETGMGSVADAVGMIGGEYNSVADPADSSIQHDLIADLLRAALLGKVGSFSPGGMSPSIPDTGGSLTMAVALVADTAWIDLSMVSWLGAEGRALLPPPPNSGILRPPRAILAV
jgi:hypothetical protein